MDKIYWENYYKTQKAPKKESLFAHYCMKNFINKEDVIIELGCGNGRDAVFFGNNFVHINAIDQCKEEIAYLNSSYQNQYIKFSCSDFTKLDYTKKIDAIYSRFTLHAISELDENNVLKWASESIKPNGYFLIEARGTQNEYYKLGEPVENEPYSYIYEGHYRRFIEMGTLCEKLEKLGFDIIKADEKAGRSPFQETDFKFLRVIAQKR